MDGSAIITRRKIQWSACLINVKRVIRTGYVKADLTRPVIGDTVGETVIDNDLRVDTGHSKCSHRNCTTRNFRRAGNSS